MRLFFCGAAKSRVEKERKNLELYNEALIAGRFYENQIVAQVF